MTLPSSMIRTHEATPPKNATLGTTQNPIHPEPVPSRPLPRSIPFLIQPQGQPVEPSDLYRRLLSLGR